jgi:hypothetical protein
MRGFDLKASGNVRVWRSRIGSWGDVSYGVGEPVLGRLGGQKKQFDGCSAYLQIRLAPLSLSLTYFLTSYVSGCVTPSSLHRDSNTYLIVPPAHCPAPHTPLCAAG